MTQVGISSQLLVEILNSDQLLLSVAGLGVITTRVMAVTVVQAAVAHSTMALPAQVLRVKETQAVILQVQVGEVAQLAVVVAVLAVWALQETQPKGKVDQVLQLQSLELQLRMQAVVVAVVGQ